MKTTNAMQLKALIKNKAKELNVTPQLVLQNYMLERLLERISKSEFADKFIVKGGFLLSSVVGLATRATMDLDATLKGVTLTKERLEEMFSEICAMQADDDVSFELLRITDIRETDDYPGQRAFLDAIYPPMRVPLTVDVTTGDVITPKEVEFCFESMFDDSKILMLAYPLETVLAEKIETILSRGIANTRPRDYYDVFVLTRTKRQGINFETLKDALMRTCEKRGSAYVIKEYDEIIGKLAENDELQSLWKKYQKSYAYAADIDFADTCEAIKEIMHNAMGDNDN